MKQTIERAIARLILALPALLIAALVLAPGRKAEATVSIPPPVQAPAEVQVRELDEPVEPDAISYRKDGYIYTDLVPMPKEYQKVMQEACRENGVPYALALGITECESSFDPWADSGVAYGYMQIAYINFDWLREEEIFAGTRKGNIDAGCRIIGELLEKYQDPHLALMAYNCGEYGASQLWDEGYTSSAYSRKVLEAASRWEEIVGE